MNKHRILAAAWFALAVGVAMQPAAARVKRAPACLPEVRDGWIRLMPGGMPMQAGFGRIVNRCNAELGITSASTREHAEVSLHETTLVEGVSRMRAVPVLNVAAKSSVELKPGGLHLMLMQPKRALQAGEVIPVRFTLKDGRSFSGRFLVKAPDL